MSKITTHILDTSKGRPAQNVKVDLEFFHQDSWQKLASGQTNDDGRVPDLLSKDHSLESGNYKIIFYTQDYFEKQKLKTFYPHVEIIFNISSPDEHYHVPLLLNGFGYSTYRGS